MISVRRGHCEYLARKPKKQLRHCRTRKDFGLGGEGGLQTRNVNLNDLTIYNKLVPFSAQHIYVE
jgi:hypothetical protein